MKTYLTTLVTIFFSIASFGQSKGLDDNVRGDANLGEGVDYNRIIELFTNGIKQYPEQPSAYNNRAIGKYMTGDLEGAIEDLNTALELSPYYPDANFNMAVITYKKGDKKQALEKFKKIAEFNAKDAVVYYNMGVIQEETVSKEAALESYNKAIELKNTMDRALNNRGYILSEQGKQQEAIEDYSKAISAKADPIYHLNRGQAYQKSGDSKSACEDWMVASELGSNKAKKLLENCN